MFITIFFSIELKLFNSFIFMNYYMFTGVATRRRATAPLFVYLTKRFFFSIGGIEDFIGVAI